MHLSPRHLLLLCVVGELLGLYVFLKGFFPIKKAVEGYAMFEGLPEEPSTETLPQDDVIPSVATGPGDFFISPTSAPPPPPPLNLFPQTFTSMSIHL